MPRCLECRREVEAGIIFCPDCGHEVTAPVPEESAEDTGEGLLIPGQGGEVASEDGESPTGEESGHGERSRDGEESGHGERSRDGEESGGADAENDDEPLPGTDVDGPSPFDRNPLSFAATYPFRAGRRPVVFGGIAEFVGTLVLLPQLLTRGYGFQLTRAAARGRTEPPAFDEFADLFVDGLRVLIVVLVYGVFFGGAGLAVLLAGSALGLPYTAGVGTLLVILGIGLLPSSLTVYAATGSFGAAFSREHAVAFLGSATYAKALVLWLAVVLGTVGLALVVFVSLGAGVVGVAGPYVLGGLPFTLVALPFYGAGFLVTAWGTYAAASVWGYYYRQAVARGIVPSPPDEAA